MKSSAALCICVTILGVLFLLSGVVMAGSKEFYTQTSPDSLSIHPQFSEVADTSSLVLHLKKAAQYMQSVQLIFELENRSESFVNNCWFSVYLETAANEFLYREQPLLFSMLGPKSSQQLELLCESVGIEEVGSIIVRPQLLEVERVETFFDKTKVLLRVDENTFPIFIYPAEK